MAHNRPQPDKQGAVPLSEKVSVGLWYRNMADTGRAQ